MVCFVSHETLAPKIDFPTGDSKLSLGHILDKRNICVDVG